MRILMINTRYVGGGGAAGIANILHQAINEINGMSSQFLYGRGDSNNEYSEKIANEYESYISALSTRIIGREFNKSLTMNLKKEIDKADIIHIHNLHGYYINYKELIEYLVKKDKKVIWTLHDTWAFTGRCAFTFNCELWKEGCGKCLNKNTYPKTNRDISNLLWNEKKELFTKLNKNKTLFITPSVWLKSLVSQSFLKGYKIKVINNGVENNKFILREKKEVRKVLGIPIDKKVILFVAADVNDERKGIKYILNILDEIKDEFIVVSMGKKLKIKNDKLIQLGYKDKRKDIYEIYNASDLYIITSLDDNFPTTVLEAFSNGIPVVGFETGGIKEQIIDGVNGFVVKNKNSNELLSKIYDVFEKKEIKKEKILEDFEKKYTISNFKNQYIESYSKL